MTPGTLHGADNEPTVSTRASPPHTECQQPKATERLPSNLPSHKRPAPTLVPALPGWGREGDAMKAQPRREGCLGLLFYNSPFSSCMEVPNTCGEAPMSRGNPGALPPTRGTQSGGGRDMGDRRGSMWRELPKSVASAISTGGCKQVGRAGQFLPLSLLCHAGNSLEANSNPYQRGQVGRGPRGLESPAWTRLPAPPRVHHLG